jgi:hypothetical protein
VREWNYCWPNRNRAAGMIEAACYAALHDIDAMILFVYETRPTARVSYFNVRSDPTRWGLCGIGAQIFLRGLIQPSRHKIVVPYGPIDTFTYTRYHQPFYALGWATRVENDFFDGDVYRAAEGSTDLIVSPGRSGVGRYEGAPAVLHSESLLRDLAGRTVYAPQYLADYGLTAVKAARATLTYNGLLFDRGARRDRALDVALPLSPLIGSGFTPIGANDEKDVANGFVDTQKQRFVFGSLEPFDILRASLDALQTFHNVPNSHDATEQNVFSSDTTEMMRDAASGRLVVSAPGFQALCGNLTGVGRVLAPGLRVRNLRSGTLIAQALDGKPLVNSRRFVIKMVTDARNADELAGRDPRFLSQPKGQWRIDVLGKGPVTTFGRAAPTPIHIGVENRPLMDVYLDRGSFELLVDGDTWQFYCDTPGAKFALYHEGKTNAPHVRPVSTSTGRIAVSGVASAATSQSRLEIEQVTTGGEILPLTSTRTGTAVIAQFPQNAAFVRATSR